MSETGDTSAKLILSQERIDRRQLLVSGLTAIAGLYLSSCSDDDDHSTFQAAIANLERQSGGRLGVCFLGLESGEPIGHRIDERFGMCSTFKLALAYLMLKESQEGRLDLDARVHYTEEDMIPHAPVTSQHLDRGFMTVAELAEATQKTSDNPAANLLLDLIGGPAGFTERLRELGDEKTRLDRYETEMNLVPHGEVRDTTTPAAMAETIRTMFTGPLLSDENKQRLRTWMEETSTGMSRIRGGLPTGWRAGDKTGTGIADSMANKYNDIAVAWPNDETPSFVLTAYYEADGTYDEIRDQDVAVLKAVGQIAAEYASASGR